VILTECGCCISSVCSFIVSQFAVTVTVSAVQLLYLFVNIKLFTATSSTTLCCSSVKCIAYCVLHTAVAWLLSEHVASVGLASDDCGC